MTSLPPVVFRPHRAYLDTSHLEVAVRAVPAPRKSPLRNDTVRPTGNSRPRQQPRRTGQQIDVIGAA
jgi:hypothetical protein